MHSGHGHGGWQAEVPDLCSQGPFPAARSSKAEGTSPGLTHIRPQAGDCSPCPEGCRGPELTSKYTTESEEGTRPRSDRVEAPADFLASLGSGTRGKVRCSPALAARHPCPPHLVGSPPGRGQVHSVAALGEGGAGGSGAGMSCGQSSQLVAGVGRRCLGITGDIQDRSRVTQWSPRGCCGATAESPGLDLVSWFDPCRVLHKT